MTTKRIWEAMNAECWDVEESNPITKEHKTWIWYEDYSEAQFWTFSNLPSMILETFDLENLMQFDRLIPSL